MKNEMDKKMELERSFVNKQLSETKELYESKIEKLNQTIDELRRQNEEKSERIMELQAEQLLQDININETRQENLDLIHNYSEISRETGREHQEFQCELISSRSTVY